MLPEEAHPPIEPLLALRSRRRRTETDWDRVAESLAQIVRQESGMADRFGRATHRIGMLECQLAEARDDRDRLAAEADADRARCESELVMLRAQLREARATIAQLRQPAKPRWRFWRRDS